MLEAFSVGVRVALIDQVSSGLFLMSGHFRRAETEAGKLQKRLHEIKMTAFAGGALIAGGLFGLAMLKGPVEEAKKLQQAQAAFATLGLGDKANAEAFRFAKSMNIIGSSYVDNLKYMTEAQGVFRESGALSLSEQLKGAKLAAPVLAQIHFATAALHPEVAGRFDAQALSMMRFIEMRGGINDPKEFIRIANLGWKAIQSSGGNVNWELLRQFMAHGGTSAQGLSDEELFSRFEPIIGELKSRAAVAQMTSYNRLEGITRVPNQVAHLLVDEGIWRKNAVIWNSMGGIKRFADNQSPLVNHELYEKTPTIWYEKILRPLYDKLGFNQAERYRENAMIFGRTGGQEHNLIDRQMPVLQKSVLAQNKAFDIQKSVKVAENTAIGQELKMRALLNNLEASAGSAILPMMVRGLQILNPMLWAVADWAKRHPKQLQAVIGGFAALSAGMVILGGIAVSGAALQSIILFKDIAGALKLGSVAVSTLRIALSPLTLGLRAVGMAIGLLFSPIGLVVAGVVGFGVAAYETWKHWATVKDMLGKLWASIVDSVSNFVRSLWNAFKGLGLGIWGWIKKGGPFGPMVSKEDFRKNLAGALGLPVQNGSFAGKMSVPPGGSVPTKSAANLDGGATRKQPPIVVQSDIYLDGKKVAAAVSRHQGDAATAPATGPSRQDTRMSPLQPAHAF